MYFWSTRFYLSTGYLTFEDIQEIKVDLMSLFELYSTIDLEYKDRIKINQRKYEFGQLFDMQNMSDQALETLEKSGSVAGYYIIADRILKLREKRYKLMEILLQKKRYYVIRRIYILVAMKAKF